MKKMFLFTASIFLFSRAATASTILTSDLSIQSEFTTLNRVVFHKLIPLNSESGIVNFKEYEFGTTLEEKLFLNYINSFKESDISKDSTCGTKIYLSIMDYIEENKLCVGKQLILYEYLKDKDFPIDPFLKMTMEKISK